MKKLTINNKSIFYSGLCYFVIMLAFIALRLMYGAGLFGAVTESTSDYIFTFVVQVLVLVGLPLLFMHFCAKQSYKTILKRSSFRAINGKMVFWSILLGFCTFALILFVSSFWSGILSMFGYSTSGISVSSSSGSGVLDLILGIIFVGVLPGFCEEFSHRGMVLGNIKSDGVGRAILLSSLMFALLHLNVTQFGYALVVGLVLGTVTLLTKSVVPGMIVHCVSNSINTYLDVAGAHGWWGGDFYAGINSFLNNSNMMLVFLISMLVLCLIVVLIFYVMFVLFRHSKTNEFFAFKRALQKRLKGTDVSEHIDLNNNEQVFKLYQETQITRLQKQMLNSNLTLKQLEQNMDKATVMSIMFDEDISKKHHIAHLDYIFYYCSIFLGAVVTFMTFLWGIL